MDNLESATYQVFETDPIKYRQYEEAVYRALIDMSVKSKETKTDMYFFNLISVVMVVGAGRGPLVDRSIRASERANVPIKLYAIEKNHNAIITYSYIT